MTAYTCPHCGMVSHNPNDALQAHRRERRVSLTPLIDFWLAQGLSKRVAALLTSQDIRTVEELRAMGLIGFRRIPNCGKIAEKEIDDVIGWNGRLR